MRFESENSDEMDSGTLRQNFTESTKPPREHLPRAEPSRHIRSSVDAPSPCRGAPVPHRLVVVSERVHVDRLERVHRFRAPRQLLPNHLQRDLVPVPVARATTGPMSAIPLRERHVLTRERHVLMRERRART